MDSDTIWRHIDAERSSLADLLDGLTETQWSTPSLCPGWTVRDVAAHLAMAQSRVGDVVGPMLRSGFSMDRMIRQSAVTSPLGHDEITRTLRGFVGSRRRAPFVQETEPLLDILVHGQDICLPLGLDRPMPLDAARVAADRMVTLNRRPVVRLRPSLRGVRLEATDTDWSTGTGTTVRGPMRALVMVVAGRGRAVTRELSGDVSAAVGA
ncbi:maleylpyruvate isomerase family mycothiol-dependent enzyme [Nocardioides daphniae]|uniref:Mycothiol-dependent maleylpyruvate isomerase metal-binding domain-containing protein n=1 Tax=Nocardioides daphniae TaxID=402297 RepID=A0ABQ1QJG1_9ACTN|nr:maleylpyruvate isomerase family mycothiol-dependent enzyme [Nocardioides daphniae]GGD29848.1 hypothetical protein GCM10007231_31670 [Nocardioides daphniae]